MYGNLLLSVGLCSKILGEVWNYNHFKLYINYDFHVYAYFLYIYTQILWLFCILINYLSYPVTVILQFEVWQ